MKLRINNNAYDESQLCSYFLFGRKWCEAAYRNAARIPIRRLARLQPNRRCREVGCAVPGSGRQPFRDGLGRKFAWRTSA